MDWTPRRKAFREILEGDSCVFPASVWDPLSARIAEDLGFETMMLAGSVASMAVLGAPDLAVLTLTELADQAGRVNRAAKPPLIVDADHGYGNALNVGRTVEELEIAGGAALTVEDTELPRAFGSGGGTRLLAVGEAVGKMRAALAARGDPALAVVGRTAAAGVTGIDDAVRRARAYREAGVDALFFTGLGGVGDVEALAGALDGPFLLGGAGTPADRDLLAARKVRACLQGHLPFAAAVQAARDVLAALRAGATPAGIGGAAAPGTIDRLTRAADYRKRMRDFLEP